MNIIKVFSIISALLLSIALFSQDKMANNIDNSNIAFSGSSPVSYLNLVLAQIGSKNFNSEYKGLY